MIGDKTSDIAAGKSAGVHTILVRTGYGGNEPGAIALEPDLVANNLRGAVELINRSALVP
jgi:phosphoglycolate phosphatase-like HAD superfamily hydrolase